MRTDGESALDSDVVRIARYVLEFHTVSYPVFRKSLLQVLLQNGMVGGCIDVLGDAQLKRDYLLALTAVCLAKFVPHCRARLEPQVGRALDRAERLRSEGQAVHFGPSGPSPSACIRAYLEAVDGAAGEAAPHEAIALQLARGLILGRGAGVGRPIENDRQVIPVSALLAAAAQGWARRLIRAAGAEVEDAMPWQAVSEAMLAGLSPAVRGSAAPA